MSDLKQEVEQNIARYAGAVLVNRALCDSRDMLKPSARTLIYSQIETSKNLPSKPYMKCARIVGDALGHWYTHGDSSCYSIYARLSKPFAMRYVLEDFHGNYGTIESSGNEAASRYTEIKLSPLGYSLFSDIEKNTIDTWEQNFDETESYPRVATSKGFYNIVNGCTGIGYGAASQIPQFNIREVNEALIKLLWNPNIDDKEIICLPDFATGAILLNKDEVIESLLNGYGKACKLRSVVEYDNKRHTFKISEIPYGVYTETIREQVRKLVNENEGIGIEGINDMSARTPDIEIYLTKTANPDKILKLLYKETSLEYYSGINMTMLENGRTPKVFTWKEALQSYLTHQIQVYTKSFKFDLNKINNRLHIVLGLIKAISILDEVIALIRAAADSSTACKQLQSTFEFTEAQAKAILDIKLSRLTHLDITKLQNEKNDLVSEKERIEDILSHEDKLKKEIEKDLLHTINLYGDERRTKILNISNENNEPIEIKRLSVSLTNKSNILVQETSSLYTQKRGGVGTKLKLDKNEIIIDNFIGDNTDAIVFFSKDGMAIPHKLSEFSINDKTFIEGDIISAVIINKESKPNLLFITEKGIVKKSLLSEYNLSRKVIAIKLDSKDLIKSVLNVDTEIIGVLSRNSHLLMFSPLKVNITGRVSRGVIGIKLDEDDVVVSASIIPKNYSTIIVAAESGLMKKISREDIPITERAVKGKLVYKSDKVSDFICMDKDDSILVTASNTQIKINTSELPLQSLTAQGVKSIKLGNGNIVSSISKIC